MSRKIRAGRILLLSVSHEIIENTHFSFYMLPFPKTFLYIKTTALSSLSVRGEFIWLFSEALKCFKIAAATTFNPSK